MKKRIMVFGFELADDGFHLTILWIKSFCVFHIGLDADDRIVGGVLFNKAWGFRW